MSELDQKIQKLNDHLARFKENGIQNRVAGQDLPGSGGAFQSISPIDKSVICHVARSNEADMDHAAKTAADAFPAWRDPDPEHDTARSLP